MRSVRLISASLLAAAMSLAFSAAAYANIAISIDKSTQRMSVAVDGQQRYVWPVSTGRRGYDTPNGTFKINRMDADHFSQEWDNAPMPHSMFFDLHGHAIHGFFDVKHLGLAVSHGCVRLSPDHAATLFDLVKTEGMANTSVSIGGSTPGGGNVPVAAARRRRTRRFIILPATACRLPMRSRCRSRRNTSSAAISSNRRNIPLSKRRNIRISKRRNIRISNTRSGNRCSRRSRSLTASRPTASPITGAKATARAITRNPAYGAPVYRQW